MLIALTGATGFIGRYIARHLIHHGDTCRCWYREGSDRSGLEDLAANLEWSAGELGGRAACQSLVRGCDAVVHAALDHPEGRFREGQGDLLEFVRKNVLSTLELIETARASGVRRFVLISSCAVHEQILDDRPLDETHPMWPTSHYGAHKAALEEFVYSYGLGEGYEICALRPCGVYGLAHRPADSKWFDLVQAVVQGQPVNCQGGGKEVHAADVAQAVQILLTAEGIAGQAYNCCDRYVSQWDVAQIARRIAGSTSEISGEPGAPRHQIATDKIRKLGMSFGDTSLLEETISQLVQAAGHRG